MFIILLKTMLRRSLLWLVLCAACVAARQTLDKPTQREMDQAFGAIQFDDEVPNRRNEFGLAAMDPNDAVVLPRSQEILDRAGAYEEDRLALAVAAAVFLALALGGRLLARLLPSPPPIEPDKPSAEAPQ
jgi:hypothetical protein